MRIINILQRRDSSFSVKERSEQEAPEFRRAHLYSRSDCVRSRPTIPRHPAQSVVRESRAIRHGAARKQFMGRGATCGYHCTAKALSFGKGQSAVHTAAYNAREKLYQEQQERRSRDYSREGEVLFKGIFAPNGAPEWTQDRQELWNRAEAAERQKANGQPARNMIVGLPHELNQQQREWLLKDFAREAFARKGMIADVAMHAPDAKGDERNYHAHILLTMRKLDGDEFAKTKCREWNRKEQLGEWREQWASMGAKALHRAGYPVEAERWRHGHQTYAEQRAAALERGDKEFAESLGNREPTFHKGVKSTALERSGGSNERLERLIARNDIRLEMSAARRRAARRRGGRPQQGLEGSGGGAAAWKRGQGDAREGRRGEFRATAVRGAAQQERVDRREKAFWAEQEAWRVSVQEQKPAQVKPVEQGLQWWTRRPARRWGWRILCRTRWRDRRRRPSRRSASRYGSLCQRPRRAEGTAACARGGGAARERGGKGDSAPLRRHRPRARVVGFGHAPSQPRAARG